jgi:hypothetical protein
MRSSTAGERDSLVKLNVDPSTMTVGEFKAFVDAEYERWADGTGSARRSDYLVRQGYAQTPRPDPLRGGGVGEGALLITLRRARTGIRRVLPLLALRRRAIAVDTPGFGNSHPLPCRRASARSRNASLS